jgi:hypothetical protein
MIGKVIYKSDNTFAPAGRVKHTVNTSGITSGIYLLTIQVGNETFTQKVAVK